MKKFLPILCAVAIISLSGCTNSSIDATITSTDLNAEMSTSNSVITSSDVEIDLTSSLTSAEKNESQAMNFYIGHIEEYSLTLPDDINWQIPSPNAGYIYAFDADEQYKGFVCVKTSYSFDFDKDMNDIINFTGNVDMDTAVVNKSNNITINGIEMTRVALSYSYENKAYNEMFTKAEYGYYFVINNNYVYISCFVVNDNATHDELNKMTEILEKTIPTLAKV